MSKSTSLLLLFILFAVTAHSQNESIYFKMLNDTLFFQNEDSTSFQNTNMNWGDVKSNQLGGEYNTTWGRNNSASENQSTAWGNGNTASSFNSTAFGNSTTASGSHATSWGAFTVASGVYSTASGQEVTVSGAHAMGWGKKNMFSSSLGAVWGSDNNVLGFSYGTAWGANNLLQAHFGTSWGLENTVQGLVGTAWGFKNTLTGDTSTVWGSSNEALAMHNTIWGRRNSSSGTFSTVWGLQNDGSADHSTMWGSFNTSSGAFGTIWGRNNRNAGTLGTVWGEDLTANSYLNTVLGRYNVNRLGTEGSWKDEETLFAIGNGNEDEGRDGLIMLKNGNIGLNFLPENGLPKEILDVNGNILSSQNVQANQLFANQKVGIGTMTPSEELEVVSTTDSSHVVIKSTASVSLLELDGATQSTVRMLDNGTVNAEMRWSGSSFDLYSSPPVTFPLIRAPTIKMTTDNYVGIRKGLSAPTEVLDVNGRVKIGDGSDPATAGVIRFNEANSAFEGYNGMGWNRMDGLPMDDDGDSKIEFAEAAIDTVKFIVNGDEQMSFNGHSLDIGKNGNTFIGHQSSRQDYNNNTGNTSLGWLATPFVLNGIENTYVGNSAGHDLTTGDYNTAVGALTLFDNQNGSMNTAIGYRAGEKNQGSGNVFIGHTAGFSATGDNKLFIENSPSPDPLIYGDFDADSIALNGDVEIRSKTRLRTLGNTFGLTSNVIVFPDGTLGREDFTALEYHATDFSDWLGLVGNIKHAVNITRDLRSGVGIDGITLRYIRFNPNVPNMTIRFMRRNLSTGQFDTLYTISESSISSTPTTQTYNFPVVSINTNQYSYFLATEDEATQIISLTLLRDL